MRDDDELALLHEPVEHADEAVDVVFVERRIHFVENAERTRAYHVNCKQQRDSCHCTFATTQKGHALQLFPRRLRRDLDAAVQRVILVQQ